MAENSLPEGTEARRVYLEQLTTAPTGSAPSRTASRQVSTNAEAEQLLRGALNPAPTKEILHVGGGVSAPTLRRQTPLPSYSDNARKLRVQGTVELMIVVLEDGTVGAAQVIRSLGYGLDEKAIEAVKQWEFTPARKDGNPVSVFAVMLTNFTLAERNNSKPLSMTTDSTGIVTTTGLPGGRYVVIPHMTGFSGFAIGALPSTSNEAIIPSLTPASTIRGVVRGPGGAIVPGVHVNLGFSAIKNGVPEFIPGANLFTNERGEFVFASLVPGEYFLQLQMPTSPETFYYPSGNDFSRARPINLGANQEISVIDINAPQ